MFRGAAQFRALFKTLSNGAKKKKNISKANAGRYNQLRNVR
jgi:hypothetical protein